MGIECGAWDKTTSSANIVSVAHYRCENTAKNSLSRLQRKSARWLCCDKLQTMEPNTDSTSTPSKLDDLENIFGTDGALKLLYFQAR